ncbi:MAG: thioesterase [Betaproteobacteria bacterium]|nr:thioesterase [Betaproteobacteria bacterium]
MLAHSSAQAYLANGLDADLPIVDAHHHIWDLQRNYHPWLCDEPVPGFRYGDSRPLRRNYLPSDYRADSAGLNIVATVYMEAEHDPTDLLRETQWVHDIAERDGLPQAMAAAAFFDREDAPTLIRAQSAFARVRSIRHKPRGVAHPQDYRADHKILGSMRCQRWREGYRLLSANGLHFELQTPWWHLDDALELARDFPKTLIILNHLGLPADRSDAGLKGWQAAMSRFAQAPNVRVKLSGICVPGQRWTPELNGWIVRQAIDLFGANRCMWASNFPVDGLVASFADILNSMLAITRDMSSAERLRIFHSTAVEVYRL